MNYKVIFTSALLFIITPTINAQPLSNKCPEVTAVQNVASNFKVKKYDENYNVWFAYQNNKFNTKNTWTFMMTDVHANNEDDAHNKFMNALKGLRFVKGADGEDGSVSCYYNAADGLKPVAKTPPFFPHL